MATEFRTVDPRGYYQYFLDQKIRPDGRQLSKVRPVCLNVGNIGTADGSALVKLGNTSIVCGIKGELVAPAPDKPKQGYLVPSVDLPALCSARYKPGPPSEHAQVVTKVIADIIQNSGCIEVEDLCIIPGKLVWCIFVDVVCLNYDGNVIDAAALAILAALKSCSLPQLEHKEDEEGFQVKQAREPLKLKGHAVATSFAIFSQELMIDPTEEEERLSDGVITVVMAEGGKICGMHKPGGAEISEEQLKACITQSKLRMKEVLKLVHNCVK